MKKLGIVDMGFLLAEGRETPMHVGGINLFTLPPGADEQEFLHGLAASLRSDEELQPPFGQRLKMSKLGLAGPVYWEEDTKLDLDYHIRHSALPKPGRYRELFALASRLHGTLLDRNRPLWEMHLIEGLQNRQFAIYSKFHHAAVDGARSMHLTQSMFSPDPNARNLGSAFSLESQNRYRLKLDQLRAENYSEQELRNVSEAIKEAFQTSTQVFSSLKSFVGGWMGKGGALALPWRHVPQSSINTPIDGSRRFVAQSWSFERVRAVGKALDGTFNDAVLAMCAGGLRLYMQKHSELPEKSLKAMVPVSLRQAGDIDSSNAVGAISADLATDISDPLARFAKIQASMIAGKALFSALKPKEAALMLQLLQMPGLLLMPLGLISRFPPFSTVISNVPGPRQTMYWDGARLDGIYPASIVTEGLALNITLVSYDGNVDFGITACRRSMPQVQRLIDYMESSLCELEQAVGIVSPKQRPSRARSVKKTKATKKKRRVSAKT
ncbi:WS/DGAT/MGAT family O-acyltransferase [Arenicella xantha]|uniref:diacylglycerol O-acyltransferase n=1 Tax=Arenicella xantha TaxID=644221 RepID=A0A395JKG7_9GAMM|nr:wax ester/triacylglycerol synthase family O-acyltransferase [Arenicella xantha]RBP51191.1 diacylglycerol O-acyltransferase [Arenicella xantha]